MAITADQRATLQLLLERGQSYGDLAQLLGQPEDEVRARARGALTELGGADPDRNVGLTDYLLGQADPIGRGRRLPAPARRPGGLRARRRLSARACASSSPPRRCPGSPAQPRPAGGGLLRRSRRPGRPTPSRSAAARACAAPQTRLIVISASAAVIVIAIVLAITGAFGGGSDDEATRRRDVDHDARPQGDQQIQQVTLQAGLGRQRLRDRDLRPRDGRSALRGRRRSRASTRRPRTRPTSSG